VRGGGSGVWGPLRMPVRMVVARRALLGVLGLRRLGRFECFERLKRHQRLKRDQRLQRLRRSKALPALSTPSTAGTKKARSTRSFRRTGVTREQAQSGAGPAPTRLTPFFSAAMHGALTDWTPARHPGNTRLPMHTRADRCADLAARVRTALQLVDPLARFRQLRHADGKR